MGKVIDVEFGVSDRGRWCVRCDEPFPEGTAMCPRCGGDLVPAARHRMEMQSRARKKARRYVATGAGLALLIVAALAWLLFGGGVARGDEKTAAPPSSDAAPATKKTSKKEKVAAVAPAHPTDGGVPFDPLAESTVTPRPVRVRLLDGSTVIGTVHAEEIGALIIDCSLGQLAIPRARISTIAYDAAAGVGQKRAPVQQLDDEDKPTKKRATQP
ncbi:MAG: hypothetical protein JWM53_5828 [bacterium]|nr:hypothetical protein [bacterium]